VETIFAPSTDILVGKNELEVRPVPILLPIPNVLMDPEDNLTTEKYSPVDTCVAFEIVSRSVEVPTITLFPVPH
jgi:hypothetical protein